MGKKRFFNFKNLFFVSFLAVAGIFSATAIVKNKQVEDTPIVEKAEAARATTLYCKMTESWWTKEGAAIGVHYWGGSTPGTTWPGVRMSAVAGQTGMWSYNVPTDATGVIFTRINGSGNVSYWGAKTKDQDISDYNEGTNLCTIASTEVWGDPGCEASWSVYEDVDPSASTNSFYIFDPYAVLGATPYAFSFNDNQKNIKHTAFPGDTSNVTSATLGITPMYSVAISQSFPTCLMDSGKGKSEGGKQTENITVANIVDKVGVIKNELDGYGNYKVEWVETTIFTSNVPSTTGYYISSSATSWTYSGSTKMGAGTGGNVAEYTSGYSAVTNQEIRVRSFYNNRYPVDQWATYGGGGDTYGTVTNDNFKFTANMSVDIYAKYESDVFKYYIDEHFTTVGYYLLGDNNFVESIGKTGPSWTFAYGARMDVPETGTNVASYVLTTTKTSTFRVKSSTSEEGHKWLAWGETYSGDKIKTVDDNVQVKAGTYTIYVNSQEKVYVAEGIPLDAFCTAFLNKIHTVCDSGGNTDPDDLDDMWSDLSSLYSSLVTEDKTTIVAIGFNGGSDADDPHRVVLAYHYIVTKYGTEKCTDFIWGNTIAASRAIIFGGFDLLNPTENDFSSVIIIIASSVALLSITTLSVLMVRKRKRKEE